MSDATDWLVEHFADGQPQYERFSNVNEAIPFLHKVLGSGQRPRLYKNVPISLTIDVDPKAPRKRRKTPPPADKPDSATPSGPGNGEAGEPKGAASPQAAEADNGPGAHPSGAPAGVTVSANDRNDPASPVTLVTIGKEVVPQPPEGAERCPAPSPGSVWACEVDTFAGDPPCPGPILYDPATHGRFCAVHTIPEVSVRAEWHRRNRERNRPLRIAG